MLTRRPRLAAYNGIGCVFALLALVTLLATDSAQSSYSRPTSLEMQLRYADLVIRGTVLSAASRTIEVTGYALYGKERKLETHTKLVTEFELDVHEVLAGDYAQSRIKVASWGRPDDTASHPYEYNLDQGVELVLMLKFVPEASIWMAGGHINSIYRVSRYTDRFAIEPYEHGRTVYLFQPKRSEWLKGEAAGFTEIDGQQLRELIRDFFQLPLSDLEWEDY